MPGWPPYGPQGQYNAKYHFIIFIKFELFVLSFALGYCQPSLLMLKIKAILV